MESSKCKNLIIFKNSTPVYQLTFKKDGVVTDITGWTVYMTVKKTLSLSDSEAIINKKITEHSDATNGQTQIELEITDTNYTGNYYYSIDYKDNDENEGVLFSGRIQFVDTVRDTKN
jgi:hypothetical protein